MNIFSALNILATDSIGIAATHVQQRAKEHKHTTQDNCMTRAAQALAKNEGEREADGKVKAAYAKLQADW